LGSAKDEFTVPDDFNDPLPPEIEDLFNSSALICEIRGEKFLN